jgi:hypothetical protein
MHTLQLRLIRLCASMLHLPFRLQAIIHVDSLVPLTESSLLLSALPLRLHLVGVGQGSPRELFASLVHIMEAGNVLVSVEAQAPRQISQDNAARRHDQLRVDHVQMHKDSLMMENVR